MIEILLKFSTVAEAAAALAKFNGTQLAATTVTGQAEAQAAAAEKPKAEKTAKPAPTPEASAPAAAPAASSPTAATGQTAAPTVDYPTLQKAVFKLSGIVKGADLDAQEHVVAIAKSLGGDTFKVLPPEKWGQALEAVNAKITDLEATLAAA